MRRLNESYDTIATVPAELHQKSALTNSDLCFGALFLYHLEYKVKHAQQVHA